MKSIRQRLTIGLLSGLGVLVILGGLFVYYSTRAALMNELDTRLQASAHAVTLLVRQEDRELEIDTLGRSMGEFELGGTEYFQIMNSERDVVARSYSLAGKGDLRLPVQARDPSPGFGHWNATLTNGTPLRVTSLQFVPQGKTKSKKSRQRGNHQQRFDPDLEAMVVVAADLGHIHGALGKLAQVLWLGGLLAMILTLLLVPWVLTHGLRALRGLALQASTITADNLDQRFATEGMPSELAPICSRLNELLSRLQTSFDRERRFSADVAHELRTPIAELKSLSEVALKWPERETQRASFQDSLAIARQMEGVVTSLLAITRCENGNQGLTRETLPIGKLMEEVWQPFKEKAQGRGLTSRFTIPPEATVESDRNLFALILANLISNAVDYAPENTRIDVNYQRRNGDFEFTVSNPAHNLTQEDLSKMSERFWRKDAARSSTEHAGLGLALARACADSLHLKLNAELSESHELRMTLTGANSVSDPNGGPSAGHVPGAL